jgi:hypothetical protein
MVDVILGGHGAVSNDNPIGPANRYFFADMEPKGYDPDRARFHLRPRRARQPRRHAVKVADAAFSGAVDAGAMFSENARAAGINLTVDRVPNDGYWDNVWMKVPFCASYWGGRAVEDHMFTTAYASGAAWNDSFWDNARFNELLVAARSEIDEDRRREMYHEMQQLVSFEGSVVIPMYNNYVMAVANEVGTPDTISANWNLRRVPLRRTLVDGLIPGRPPDGASRAGGLMRTPKRGARPLSNVLRMIVTRIALGIGLLFDRFAGDLRGDRIAAGRPGDAASGPVGHARNRGRAARQAGPERSRAGALLELADRRGDRRFRGVARQQPADIRILIAARLGNTLFLAPMPRRWRCRSR